MEKTIKEILKEDTFVSNSSKEEYQIDQIEALLKIVRLAKSQKEKKRHFDSLSDYGYNACTSELDDLLIMKTKSEVRFTSAKLTHNGKFYTSSRNTKISQRKTLEAIIENLCHSLGIFQIEKVYSSRMSDFYRPAGFGDFQSASNVILDLSRRIAFEKILHNCDKNGK